MNQYLERLVEERGIESNFIDAWGKPAVISEQSKIKLLKAMGYDTENESALAEQVQQEAEEQWLTPLNPVKVSKVDEHFSFVVRVAIEHAASKHKLVIGLENGDEQVVDFVPVDNQLQATVDISDIEFQQYLVTTDLLLPLGYHALSLKRGNKKLSTGRQITVPHRCFIPNEIQAGKKIWGLSVQLYCLRSEANWGVGDFSDLANLVEKAALQGADFIGLNPIHALYPSNPDACSPYGPSSRRWLNSLYIDVTTIDTFGDEDTQAWFNSEDIQQKLSHLRSLEYIDYEGVAEVKYEALKRVFKTFKVKHLSKNTKLYKAFKAFIAEGGESLATLSICEALQETLKRDGKDHWGWPVFPDEFKDFDSPEVAKFAKKEKDLVEFYQFLQWQAAQQFEVASDKAKNSGMLLGLYRDLAVGVSEGSAEIWGNKSLYCTDASVGAPPDILGPLGQNWGLPPMDPQKLYEQAYQPIIDLFSSNMKKSGALRIDHVMALLRLWWVYRGDDAGKGGYVYYPVDDLLGILALESVRNESLVIGEDLGTVPEEIRSKLADNGMYSYRLFFFEQAEDGGFYSPSHYPVQSMCTLTTHDMPTLSGYWHCDDLALGKEVGLYPDQDVLNTLYNTRHDNKQQILNTLHGHHSISEHISRDVNHVGMTTELNYGMQTHMASGSSALLSLQLEDWLQMDKPVNIPGTFKEYPNWKRKLNRNLVDIFNDQSISNLAKAVDNRRKAASTD